MKLKSFGCSFIFGTDLPDDGRGNTYATPSKKTWPAILAQQNGLDYVCYARPGSGNLQILNRVLDHAASGEKDLFVIGWTWIDRFDHTTLDDQWQTIMPIDQDHKAKFYYADLHSQYRDKFTTLMAIKLAGDTLTQKGIPFLMTYMDQLIFETKWHTSPAMSDMQHHVTPWLKDFETLTFLDWSKKHGYPISETLHPLEQAHQQGARVMAPILDAILHKV